MSDHYVWLIERGTTPGETEWWGGDGVTKDAYQAVWFPTKAAAELTIQRQRLGGYWFATEHGFIENEAAAGYGPLEPYKEALSGIANMAHLAWTDKATIREAFEWIENTARATLESGAP